MNIQHFYDERTHTLTYVIYDPETRDSVVIDPVLDYDDVGSKLWTESVDEIIQYIQEHDLQLHYILETHAHADHLSGAQRLKEAFPYAKTAIGERITEVQEVFKARFDLPDEFPTDGRQFDLLLADKSIHTAGTLSFETIFTPGHTPACATYRFGDAIFTGDTMFMPDQGTGRCDFPAGSADALYTSVTERLYTLDDDTRVFVGHDYQPEGRELQYESTIGAQKADNIQLPADRSKEEFIAFRQNRDARLRAPRLLFQSIQVNVDAGHLPKANEQGAQYLKIPLNVFRPQLPGTMELHEITPSK